jgi:hypothetical protein
MVDQIDQPRIIPDPGTDPAIGRRIAQIERNILRNPEAFQDALTKLGELATLDTISVDTLDERVVSVERTPARQLAEFFGQRYDHDSEFDETTEDCISTDERHRELIKQHRALSGSLQAKAGVMTTVSKQREGAEPLRDLIRRSRLQIFIGRVSIWKQQNPDDNGSRLSSAG